MSQKNILETGNSYGINTELKGTKVSNSALSDGLGSLPIEVVNVEKEWQAVQDHIEDGNMQDTFHYIKLMENKMSDLKDVLIKKWLAA